MEGAADLRPARGKPAARTERGSERERIAASIMEWQRSDHRQLNGRRAPGDETPIDGAQPPNRRPSSGLIHFGMPASVFRDQYLERQWHLQRRALCDTDSLDWSDFDAVLHQIEPRAPIFQLFNQGPIPEERYTNPSVRLGQPWRRLDKQRFYAELGQGATLVINRFEDYSLPAKRLCSCVSRYAQRQAIGNAYLSVGGRGTFGKHWDTHDVFAIQLIGRKRWQVFHPSFSLPLSMHGSESSGHRCPEEPVLDCVLEPGDLLYLPRGWWHQAIPLDEPSLHFSIGAYAPTVHDYLMWAVSRYMPQVAEARLALDQVVDDSTLESVSSALSAIIADPRYRAEYERELASRESLSSEFNTALFLEGGADALPDEAELGLTASHDPSPEQGEISINGRRLRLDLTSLGIVALLANTTSLRLDAICARRPHEDPSTLRRAVLELARHDIVSIRFT